MDSATHQGLYLFSSLDFRHIFQQIGPTKFGIPHQYGAAGALRPLQIRAFSCIVPRPFKRNAAGAIPIGIFQFLEWVRFHGLTPLFFRSPHWQWHSGGIGIPRTIR